jgi:lipopolysaccharide cholinephosphotransferase
MREPVPDFLPDYSKALTDVRRVQLILLRMLKIVDFICSKHDVVYWLDGGTLLGAVRHGGFIPWDDDLDIVMPRLDYERFLKIAPQMLPEDIVLQTLDSDPSYRTYAVPCKLKDRKGLRLELDTAGNAVFLDIIPIDKFRSSGTGYIVDYGAKRLFKRLVFFHDAKPIQGMSLKGCISNVLFGMKKFVDSERLIKRYRRFLVGWIKTNTGLRENYRLGYGFDAYWLRFFLVDEIYPLKKMAFEDAEFWVPCNTHAVLTMFYGDYMTLPAVSRRIPEHSIVLAGREDD